MYIKLHRPILHKSMRYITKEILLQIHIKQVRNQSFGTDWSQSDTSDYGLLWTRLAIWDDSQTMLCA